MRELGSDLECDAQLQGSQLLECLCKNRNYAFGVLDCTRQYCDPEVAATESDKAFEAAKAECQSKPLPKAISFAFPVSDSL